MRRMSMVVALGMILAGGGSLALAAQETPIYTGNLAAAPVRISIGSWGSGTLQETAEMKLSGPNSLKFVSQGDFQGGVITFATPLDISTYAGQPNAYIEVWARPFFRRVEPKVEPAQPAAPTAAAAPAVTAPPSRVTFGARRDDDDDGRGGPMTGMPFGVPTPRTYGQPGVAPGAAPAPAVTPPAAPAPPPGPAAPAQAAFRTPAFRVQLMTERGAAVLADYPVYPAQRTDAGWIRIGFPLAKFQGPLGDRLRSIALLSQRGDTFFLGEMRLRLETSEIRARPGAYPASTRVGQPIVFLANVDAGLTPVEVSWDFNDADGIQDQAQGPQVVNVYNVPGSYLVTMTARPATGGDIEPRVYKLLVHVK